MGSKICNYIYIIVLYYIKNILLDNPDDHYIPDRTNLNFSI